MKKEVAVVKQPQQAVAAQPQNNEAVALRPAERLLNAVAREFSNMGQMIEWTGHQKQLGLGYFVGIDRALKAAEDKRIDSNKWKREPNDVPYDWKHVNVASLAVDMKACIEVGLDMNQTAQVYAIPYLNKRTGLYDITLMRGYAGKELVVKKYALEQPVSVTFHLVKEEDDFTPLLKSVDREYDTYKFEVTKPFNRGEVTGAFGYIEYKDPKKNKLVWMSKKDMDKRKPKYASPEFWGGTKKVGKDEIEVEGWKDEMYLKTIKREVYSTKYFVIDSEKTDTSYQQLEVMETRAAHALLGMDAEEKANKITFQPSDAEAVNVDKYAPKTQAVEAERPPQEMSPEERAALNAEMDREIAEAEGYQLEPKKAPKAKTPDLVMSNQSPDDDF